LTSDGTWTYTYDGNLNQAWRIKSTEKWIYQWNSLDQLTTVFKGTLKQGKWTWSTIGTYSYDANGARAKTVEGSTTIEYTFIGHDPMCEKTGTTYTDYVYINGKVSEKLVGTSIYHYLIDPMIGSTWQVWSDGATSATSSVKCYQPFGTPYTPSGTEKVKYAGEILDASTGLYYVLARYMDPTLGRFISLDPKPGELSEPQGFNRFVYCLNNPLRIVDPTGEWGFKLPKISLKTVLKVVIIVATVAACVATAGIASPLLAVAASAAIGAISSAADTAISGGSLTDIAKSALIGGAFGAVTGGVGQVWKTAGKGALMAFKSSAGKGMGGWAKTTGKILTSGKATKGLFEKGQTPLKLLLNKGPKTPWKTWGGRMVNILKGDLKDIPKSWTKMDFWRPWAQTWLMKGVVEQPAKGMIKLGVVGAIGWLSG
jgi:RHS repeat-associated protein